MLDRLRRLLDHLEWANRRALDAARAANNREALRILGHILGTEEVWLARIETGDSSDREIWPELSFETCEVRMDENLEAFRRLLEGMEDGDLDRAATYRNSKGTEFHTPVGEILLHVLLHGSYHRGQVAKRMRYAGAEPVNTDFITFVREKPAGEG